MKNYLTFGLFLAVIQVFSQSLDFGLEVQQNTNLVKKRGFTDEPSDLNKAFSIKDINGDTMNVYFTTFSMSNNFEIPLYFRFNFKKRYFLDFKLSNTAHTLYMEGVSNYNRSYFVSNYGTYNDFVIQAQASGFSSVDTSDYTNYINSAMATSERVVSSKEEFKVLSTTANLGIRLFPQRSIHPYITAGFTVKGKYRKYTYQHLNFTSDAVYDHRKINQGVNKFAENTFYINLGAGIEFYRFRAGLYYQAGGPIYFANGGGTDVATGITNDVVISVNPNTTFARIHSYGFTISANLFSTPIGKRVIYDDLSSEEIILSNIQKKKYKWDFGLRFNRRGYNDVSTFYTTDDNRLSIMSRDSILYNNGTTIQSAEKVEMLTFGDVKRISWSGQLDFVATRHFGRRFTLEASAGTSSLTTDIETTEFTGTVLHDTIAGSSYLYNNATPRITSGVYRNVFNMSNFTLSVGFKIIDRDLFGFSVFAGSGYTTMTHRSLELVDLPDGVNELEIYSTIDKNYYTIGDNSIYAYQGAMDVDLQGTPDALFSKFGTTKLDKNWQTPEPQRARFPMVKFGVEASVDRFTLGLSMDRSRNYMDGFLLNKYSSVYFSIGYKFIRR